MKKMINILYLIFLLFVFIGNINADDIKRASGSGTGDMSASIYDPQSIADDAFDLSTHTGIASVVQGGIGTNTAYLEDFELAGTTTIPNGTIDSNGYLGIGTTTPQSKLHVNGTLTANTIDSATFNNGMITNSTLGEGTSFVGNIFSASGDLSFSTADGNTLQLGSTTAGTTDKVKIKHGYAPYVLYQNSTGTDTFYVTGTTSSQECFSVTLPGGSMLAHGKIVIWYDLDFTDNISAGNSFAITFGGEDVYNTEFGATIDACRGQSFIANTGSTTTQVITDINVSQFFTQYNSPGISYSTATIDTASDVIITGSIQVGSSTEFMQLTSITIEVLPYE